MKKLIAMIMATALLTSSAPVMAANELPALGDVSHGFTVEQIVPMDVLGAVGVLFKHDKSGAELLYMSTGDTNRSFDITFKTPALDDKGKPHVFEHITISGSEKYPDANLFFPFINQTYNTFVNAFTYSGMTSFPVASLSEDQLMTMMDYYLSGVFTPLLYTEPRLAKREAWRYEMTSQDEPLNIAGTVYSEMQGAMDVSSQAKQNAFEALFEGSPVAHNSGGDPEDVRTLTSEELIAFHDAYYHPSNALIILYGDLDYDRFLEYIDAEYLSKYDKKDVYVEVGKVEPYKETLYKIYDAPVENGAQTEKSSYIYYSFAADEATMEDAFSLMMLASFLNSEASPLMRGVREKLPGASVSVGVEIDMPTPAVQFIASGVNESDRDVLVKTVDEAIDQIVENGVNADDFESVLSIQKLSLMLTQESSSLGVNSSVNIALGWTRFADVGFYNAYESVVKSMTASDATALTEKYFKNNTHRSVALTRPVAGLAEENAQKLRDELDAKKAGMTDEEIADLVARSNEFLAWSAAEPDGEVVDSLVNFTVDELPEEIRHYDVTDEVKDGVRYVESVAEVPDVAQMTIKLDAQTIPAESLRDCQLYLQLAGQLDTENHTKEELSTLITRYLPSLSASLTAVNSYDGKDGLYSNSMTWIGLKEDAERSVALLGEILLKSKFDDSDTIVDALTRMNSQTKDSFDAMALSIQLSRAIGTLNDENAFNAYISGIDMYRHIDQMLKTPEEIPSRLAAARELLFNRKGAIVEIAGAADAVKAYEDEIAAFIASLPEIDREKTDMSLLRSDIKSEAVINNSGVHMNVIAAKQTDYNGKLAPLSSLLNDMYLLPKLRNALGAYGAYANFGTTSSLLYTYRDPNLAGTFEAFGEMGEFLRTADIDQNAVDSYIIGSYKTLSAPMGELSGALRAVNYHVLNLSEETRLEWQRQAKSLTVEDVRGYADMIDEIVKTGVRSTSGTVTSIGDDIGMFDSVVRLDSTKTNLENAA